MKKIVLPKSIKNVRNMLIDGCAEDYVAASEFKNGWNACIRRIKKLNNIKK